jgi:hypothetical protein
MEVLIKKLCYIDKEFEKYKNQEDEDLGYIFIIKNELYSVFDEPIIILDYGTKKSIEEKYNKLYLEKISIKSSKKIEYVEMVYKLLLILLNEYQIAVNKNFISNEIQVKKELDMLGIHLKKKDGLETWINYVLTSINKSYGSIGILKNKLKEKKEINLKCINPKENMNMIKIKKIKDSLEKISKYESDVRKYGFIVVIESEELEKYYKGEITYILICEKYKESIERIFVKEPKIKSYRVYNYEMCELIVKDKLRNVNISNGYYMCKKDKANEIIELVSKYYEKYDSVEKLKNAYLYDEYRIGKKTIEENIKVVEKIDYINTGKERRHKKIKEEEKFDEEKLYNMLKGIKEEIEEAIERKSRYELVCDRLKKKLK